MIMIRNEIYVDYMTRKYNNLIKSLQPQVKKPERTGSFLDEVAERLECQGRAEESAAVGSVSTKDMTLEEYKQYIYDKISQIPLHPSQRLNSIAVFITDDGFEAMQEDPEYEKWVLDSLAHSFGFHDPWANLCGGSFTIHHFGADKEAYHGESWFKGFQNGKGQTLFDKKSKDSFWERRLRHKKLMKQQLERWQEKRWLENKKLQKMYEEEMYQRSVEQMHRIAGKDYQSPERRLPLIHTAYQTSILLDMLISK